jgi:hypothetical protein
MMGAALQTPEDIANFLTEKLRRHFESHGLQFNCYVVGSYRKMRFPNSIGLYGAYKTREGIEAPHSFTFVPRGWLSVPLQQAIEQRPPFMAIRGSHDRSIQPKVSQIQIELSPVRTVC